jgi:5-methylcytosine-specific restriction enzyme subunit McrC
MKTISRFEHECLRLGDKDFGKAELEALQAFHGEEGCPYFSLIHKGVKFNSYVGILQVGELCIEILPKADKVEGDELSWRSRLIDMLQVVHQLQVKAPSSAQLKLKPNALLDLYFQQFVQELESLIHKGLIKKYQKVQANRTALKGQLVFSKHIQQNIVHKERFFVQYSQYNKNHKLHQILYKALRLLARINQNTQLKSRIGALLLDFPEMPDLKVTDASFQRIVFNRKTEPYRNALEIARMILLNYHPDLVQGKKDVLALLFDMNQLWEEFVYISLRKMLMRQRLPFQIKAQKRQNFWCLEQKGAHYSYMKPDIFIEFNGQNYVLDTKWKNLQGNPSQEDLRQLYVYHQYFQAEKVALLYPSPESYCKRGSYLAVGSQQEYSDYQCALIGLELGDGVKDWQEGIGVQLKCWME